MAPLLATPSLLVLAALALTSSSVTDAAGAGKPQVNNTGKFKGDPWTVGHATFYGGRDGSGTKDGGACGYKDAEVGFGVQTAAVSPGLFGRGNDRGAGCGACYEVKCANSSMCINSKTPMVITANNEAPPPLSGYQGEHFDLTMPVFLSIAEEKAGIIPISYRKVPCPRKGGIRFTITGNKNYNMVMPTNVGGAGDVAELSVKGNKRVKWTPMRRSWGQTWVTEADLTGETLTFRVVTGDRRIETSWHAAPRDWQFGKTYQATTNF